MASITRSGVSENLSKMEAQLKVWSTKLNEAVARAGDAGHQAKLDSRKQIDELKVKLDAARAKLDEAKAAGGEKWESLKGGVESTWHEIEVAFKKLLH
ncbi:MAG: coiled coil domain-containing protein [Kofleriaceae bacterium]|nr:MAG: coiled coil domain-containing protein [Kofleriaceae bacterium]MBZ0231253.1 coiled coil domain-containing protein [Kofleriaceae bacterium]